MRRHMPSKGVGLLPKFYKIGPLDIRLMPQLRFGTHMKTCPHCSDGVKTCPDCNGDGVVDKDTDDERQCPTCGGLGFVPDDDKDHEEVIKTRARDLPHSQCADDGRSAPYSEQHCQAAKATYQKEADRLALSRTALGKCLLNRVTLCLEEVVILLPRPDCRREIGSLPR